MINIYYKKIQKMVKFGLLKSKIETILVDSFPVGSFKYEMKNFKSYVLENKKILKAFHLYNELSDKKNLSESFAKDFVDESINVYKSINLTKKDLEELDQWTSKITCENKYEMIDNLLSNKVVDLMTKVKSKRMVVENLMSKSEEQKEVVKIPISTMINIANKTFSNFIETLDESEKKELMSILTMDDDQIKNEFTTLQESTIDKLNLISESEENVDIKKKINETIDTIKDQKAEKFNYFKLKKLSETI